MCVAIKISSEFCEQAAGIAQLARAWLLTTRSEVRALLLARNVLFFYSGLKAIWVGLFLFCAGIDELLLNLVGLP